MDGFHLTSGGNIAQEHVPVSRLAETAAGEPENDPAVPADPLFGLYTPRIDPAGFTSLDARPGWLRLTGQESFSSLNRSSILAHKLTSLHAHATVTLDMEPVYFQAYAGIMIYYDNMDYVLLRKAYREGNDEPVLDLLQVENGERRFPAGCEVPVRKGPVQLRVTVDGRATRFSWRYPDQAWQPIGPAFNTSHFSDEYCKSGEFTGTFLGFGCVDALLHRAYADFAHPVCGPALLRRGPPSASFQVCPVCYPERQEGRDAESKRKRKRNLIFFIFTPLSAPFFAKFKVSGQEARRTSHSVKEKKRI